MVAATLVLLCTRPLEFDVIGQAPWLMTLPAIAIIGREVKDETSGHPPLFTALLVL